MVQAISSRGGEGQASRPPLQGNRMRIEGGQRRANLAQGSATRQGGPSLLRSGGTENVQPNGGGAAQGFELNSGSMFQYGNGGGANSGQEAKAEPGATNLKLRQLFGVNPEVKQGLLVIDDSQIVYVCGHNTVLYNVENKTSRFIQGVEGTQGITALAVSDNRKFLAVCERAEQAICFIYEVNTLKRRRVLTSSESTAKEFIDVKFAHSEEKLTNFLFTLTGKPDFRLVIWLWDKQRFVAQQRFDVDYATKECYPNQASFNPSSQADALASIIVLGTNCFKYFKLLDNGTLSLKTNQLYKKDPRAFSSVYTCHAWVNDQLIIGTDHGELLFCDHNCDFKFKLVDSPGSSFRILNILALKGDDFMIADGSGGFCHYEATGETRNPFKLFKSNLPYSVDMDDSKWCKHLEEQDSTPYFPTTCMEQLGDYLIYVTRKRQILKMRIQKEKTDDFGKISYLTIPFHRQKFTAVATCMKQPILVTAASDQTIMIWHYTSHPGSLYLQVVKKLQDAIQAVAIHPTGFYIVIAHIDRVRIYTIHSDDVAVAQFLSHEVRGCTEISFANGGHLYAVNDEEGNIQVFKFWQNELMPDGVFQGHQSPVKSIVWLEDDTGFISCGRDDHQVILWKLKPDQNGSHIVWQHRQQLTQFYDVQFTENDPFFNMMVLPAQMDDPLILEQMKASRQNFSKQKDENDPNKQNQTNKVVVFASSRDGSIRELLNGKSRSKYETGYQYSTLRLMHGQKAFFAGVANPNQPGAIHVVGYPFSENRTVQELQVHEAPVAKLTLNYEHTVLFSGAEDGSLAIMAISDRPKGAFKDVQHITQVLFQGKQLRQWHAEITENREELEERKKDSANRVASIIGAKKREIDRLTKQLEYEEQKLNSELNEKQREKDEMLRYQVEKRKELEDLHARQLRQMKVEHERKKTSDEEKFEALLDQKEQAIEQASDTIRQLKMEQDDLLDKMTLEHNEELSQAREEVARLREQEKGEHESIIQLRRDAEERAWNEIDQMTDKNKDILAENIERGLENKAELTKYSRELDSQNLEKSNKQKDLQEKKTQLENKMIEQQKIRADIAACEEQYRARISTIEEKDMQIGQLQKKIQELEKFKFVLDYKIKELKRDICPKEVQIQKLNEQTNKMRSEQKQFDRVNSNLVLIVDDLRMRQEGLSKASSQMESKIGRQENTIKRFKDDVQQMLFKNNLSYKDLKKGVVRLYRTWVLEERVKDTGTTDVYQIYNQQRTQIENNVKTLQDKLQKETKKHTQENQRILKENVQLIKELNQLRAEEQKLKVSVRQTNQSIKSIKGSANTSTNFANGSQQSFAQRRIRVQSAVNTRTKELGEARKEKDEMEEEARRYQVELQEIKQRNEEIRLMITQKREQQLTQQFNQTEGDGGAFNMGQPQYVIAHSGQNSGGDLQQVVLPDWSMANVAPGQAQPQHQSRQPDAPGSRPSDRVSYEQDIDGVPIRANQNFQAAGPTSHEEHKQETDQQQQQPQPNMFHQAAQDDQIVEDEDDEAQEIN